MNKLPYILVFLLSSVSVFSQNVIHPDSAIAADPSPKLLSETANFTPEEPSVRPGTATLTGYITGYDPGKKYKGEIRVSNPILDEWENSTFETDSNGYFLAAIPMIATSQVFIRSPFLKEMLILTPGKESSVYIDLKKAKQNEAAAGKSHDTLTYIRFSGANADLNSRIHSSGIFGYLEKELSVSRIKQDASFMTGINQYKEHIENKYRTTETDLRRMGTGAEIYRFALLEAELRCIDFLLMGNYIFREMEKQNNDPESPVDFDPVVGYDYYSFLTNSAVNKPVSLCSGAFTGIVNSCGLVGYTLDKYKTRYRVRSLTTPMIQKLIDSGMLSPEETMYAELLKNELFENWSRERTENYKKEHAEYATCLLNTNKLSGRSLQLVRHLQALSSAEQSDIRAIYNLAVNIPIQILEDRIFSNKYLQQLSDSIITRNEVVLKSSGITIDDFLETYKDEIDFMQEKEYRDKQKKILSDILGTDKGILFDMLTLNAYGKKIKRKISLTRYELEEIAGLGNPYYSEYLTAKNNEILTGGKENNVKFHIYKTPVLNDDLILSEIANMFADNIIFVTFWATWNEPSMLAINMLEKVKKRYREKEIIYIYLTDESSPVKVWENHIRNIPGEHFRLKNRQLGYLKEALNFNGFPSFLVLDKKRKQIYVKEGYNQFHIINILDKEAKLKR